MNGTDPEVAAMPVWRRWLQCFAGVFTLSSISLYAIVVVVDPFATGRFALTQRIDVTSDNTRLAKAGLVRDPQFDSAIFGNSASFNVDPAVIGAGTGHRVVHLAISMTVPSEQLLMARLFAKFHPGIATQNIFIVDDWWCEDNSLAPNLVVPFPFWLYMGSNREYLSRIFFMPAVEAAAYRVGIWLGIAQQVERNDGFGPAFKPADPAAAAASLDSVSRPVEGPPAGAPFPAIAALGEFLGQLPPGSTAALVLLPTFANNLPLEGSLADARLQACKAQLHQTALNRPRTTFVDLRTDNPLTRDAHNFSDVYHFRPKIAQWVMTEIITALRALSGPSTSENR